MTRAALIAVMAVVLAHVAPAAETCDSRAAKKNEGWAKTHHSFLADVQHKQDVELQRTWCHIFETIGFDKVEKGIDFGRVLFTGDGLHPSVGGIVPGSGFAGGLVYNFERATQQPPIRYSGSIEARGSYNGFWTAGGKLDIWGAANNPQDRHIHATLDAEHYNLPQMTYFGQGNSSFLADESLFSLAQNTAGGHIDIPIVGGFVLVGGLAGLWNSQGGVTGASLPSIDQKFNSFDAPGLNRGTSYVVSGGGLQWLYPVAPRLNGFSSALSSGFRFFAETSGAPYSFRRLEVIWINRYRPPTNFDLGTISGTVRFVDSYTVGNNQIPFYLQPTLGGTDINNVDVLRSYRDYRFRAPNLLAVQAEYMRTIWGPLAFLGFYDTGRVAEQRSDIGFTHMHHSFGAGFVIQLGGAPLMKFYYAWGGGESTHTTYTMNTNNFTVGAPAGVF